MGYSILEKQNLQPRTPIAVLEHATFAQVRELLPPGKLDAMIAVDIETNGLDASDPACFPVGIGFADATGCFYIDLQTASEDAILHIKVFLRRASCLVGFNIFFDGAFLARWTGRPLKWRGDAFGLFKQMSGEGWTGQKWSLGTAITDILGWPVSSKQTLEAALTERGLSKGEMWKLPVPILGEYCAHDSEATYQLWSVLYERAAKLP